MYAAVLLHITENLTFKNILAPFLGYVIVVVVVVNCCYEI